MHDGWSRDKIISFYAAMQEMARENNPDVEFDETPEEIADRFIGYDINRLYLYLDVRQTEPGKFQAVCVERLEEQPTYGQGKTEIDALIDALRRKYYSLQRKI